MKTCYVCKQTKAEDAFNKNKRKSDGLDYQCKPCAKKYYDEKYGPEESAKKQEYYNRRRENILESRHKDARTASTKYRKLKNKSKNWGLGFDISLEDYIELTSKPCTYCGGALPEAGSGVDRIDSNLGYTKTNSAPCCTKCNIMKGRMTITELSAHICAVYEFWAKKIQ